MNPVFLREQMAYFRAPKLFGRSGIWGALFFSVVLLAAGFAMTYPEEIWGLFGQYAVWVFVFVLPILPLRIVASFDSVVGEKEHNSYNTLVVSALTPLGFVLGKTEYLFFQVSLAQAVLFPLMILASLFGGHSLSFVWIYFLLLLAQNALLAILHLYLSSIPFSQLNAAKWARFYSAYSLQKNMASSLISMAYVVPLSVCGMLFINSMNYGNPFSQAIPVYQNTIRFFASISPPFVLLFWGDLQLYGYACPLWIFSLVLHLFLTVHLVLCTEGHHRNIENDPSIRFRSSLFAFFLFLEIIFIGLFLPYGFSGFLNGSLSCALLVILYMSFKLGLVSPQPNEKQFFASNHFFHFREKGLFASYKRTSILYFFCLFSVLSLVFFCLGIQQFGYFFSLSFLQNYVLITFSLFLGLFGLAHFLSALRNESLQSPLTMTLLVLILYVCGAVAPEIVQKVKASFPSEPLWFALLSGLVFGFAYLNPFLLFYSYFLALPGYTGSKLAFSLVVEPLPASLLFALGYCLFGMLFFLLGQQAYKKEEELLAKERPRSLPSSSQEFS